MLSMIGFMNKAQIDNLLKSEVVGRIGCAADGKIYVVPVTYVYDDGRIYTHTAVGLKVDMMRANPQVCFEVDHIDNLASWQSVIAWGTYEELKGNEANDALQKIIDRVHPLVTSETSVPHYSLERVHEPINPHIELVVFCINLQESTGKFEKQG